MCFRRVHDIHYSALAWLKFPFVAVFARTAHMVWVVFDGKQL